MARNNKINDSFFFFRVPIVIVILAKNKTNGILAAQNMEFVAEVNGLRVLYSGFFTMAVNALRKIRKENSIPKGKKVAMTLALGYLYVKVLMKLRGTILLIWSIEFMKAYSISVHNHKGEEIYDIIFFRNRKQ